MTPLNVLFIPINCIPSDTVQSSLLPEVNTICNEPVPPGGRTKTGEVPIEGRLNPFNEEKSAPMSRTPEQFGPLGDGGLFVELFTGLDWVGLD